MGTAITNAYDKRMLEKGFDSFTVNDKNEFIMQLANRQGVPITEITKEYLLDYHRELKIQHLSNIAEQEIIEGFTAEVNGHEYRTNRDDQLNMLGLYVFARDNEAFNPIYWKVENQGRQVAHERDEFFSIVREAFMYKLNILKKLDDLRNQIYNATSDAQIVGIQWG